MTRALRLLDLLKEIKNRETKSQRIHKQSQAKL